MSLILLPVAPVPEVSDVNDDVVVDNVAVIVLVGVIEEVRRSTKR